MARVALQQAYLSFLLRCPEIIYTGFLLANNSPAWGWFSNVVQNSSQSPKMKHITTRQELTLSSGIFCKSWGSSSVPDGSSVNTHSQPFQDRGLLFPSNSHTQTFQPRVLSRRRGFKTLPGSFSLWLRQASRQTLSAAALWTLSLLTISGSEKLAGKLSLLLSWHLNGSQQPSLSSLLNFLSLLGSPLFIQMPV